MESNDWEKLTKTYSVLTERELEEELIILKKERSEWQSKQIANKRYMLPPVKFCEEKVYEYNVKINAVKSVSYWKIENGKWYNKLKTKIENTEHVKFTLSVLGASFLISVYSGVYSDTYGFSFFDSIVNLIFVVLPLIILVIVLSEVLDVFSDGFSFDKQSVIVKILITLLLCGFGLLVFLGWCFLSFSLGYFSLFD